MIHDGILEACVPIFQLTDQALGLTVNRAVAAKPATMSSRKKLPD